MDNLFLLLFLGCFIALIVGVFKPKAVIKWGNIEKRNRKSVFKYYGIGLIVFFILFGATTDNTANTQENNVASTAKSNIKELTAEEKAAAEKVAAEKAAADKAAAEKSAADKAAAEKAAAEKAAAEKAAAEKAAAEKAEADRVAYDTGITYNQLARTPNDYKGKKVKFTGKVIQVIEGKGEINLRIAVDNNYDTILLVAYKPSITPQRVLENDNVTIKGISQGIYTYDSTMGGKITVPLVFVDIITINN